MEMFVLRVDRFLFEMKEMWVNNDNLIVDNVLGMEYNANHICALYAYRCFEIYKDVNVKVWMCLFLGFICDVNNYLTKMKIDN